MRARAMLFTAMALIEVGAGLSLLGLPALGISLLLGVEDPALEALIVGRVCGAGLLAHWRCMLARTQRCAAVARRTAWCGECLSTTSGRAACWRLQGWACRPPASRFGQQWHCTAR